jgi:hypothetical protein
MHGTIRFRHDVANDIHFAYPKWYVETEEDCRVWAAQYEKYFSQFARKVDAIMVLDEFRIGPGIGSIWGKYRAECVARYTRYSVRINADARVSTFNATSAVLYRIGSREAPDVESAIALIRELRRTDAPDT